jgi:hypothetical protein
MRLWTPSVARLDCYVTGLKQTSQRFVVQRDRGRGHDWSNCGRDVAETIGAVTLAYCISQANEIATGSLVLGDVVYAFTNLIVWA